METNLRSAEEKGKKKISPIFVNQQAEKNGEGNLLFFCSSKDKYSRCAHLTFLYWRGL